MDIVLITWFVRILGAYLAFGILFALYFVSIGVNRIDPNAAEGSLGFRLLIIPGTILLWPILFTRLIKGQQTPPIEKTAHRCVSQNRD